MEKRAYLLTECTDDDEIYRVLVFDANINKKDIQLEIYKIINHFYEEDFDGWCVEDVLEELAKKYDFENYGFDRLEV